MFPICQGRGLPAPKAIHYSFVDLFVGAGINQKAVCQFGFLELETYQGGLFLIRLWIAKSLSATQALPVSIQITFCRRTHLAKGVRGRMQSLPTGCGVGDPTKMNNRRYFSVASRLPRRAFSPPRNDVQGLFGEDLPLLLHRSSYQVDSSPPSPTTTNKLFLVRRGSGALRRLRRLPV